jgi:hypothetical protein
MLPLCVTESYLLYDESRSKLIANFNGTHSPSGKYDCVVDRLCKQAATPINVPSGNKFRNLFLKIKYPFLFLGLTIGQHDNDQILGVTHEQKGKLPL